MKVQTRAVQNDVIRGVRWGAILVLSALLAVAGYRMISSSPAEAAPVAKPAAKAATAPAFEVGAASTPVEQPKLPASIPASTPKPIANRTPQPDVPEPPPRKPGASRTVAAVTPKTFTPKETVVEGTLPDATVEAGGLPQAEVSGAALPPPPDAGPGRTGKIVRSVGRILKIGKKKAGEP